MRTPTLLGNAGLRQRLAAAGNQLSHCYILEGPKGSGKHTLAGLLSAAMECEEQNVPCCQCGACRIVLKNEHPDVITVDSDTATVPIRLIRDMQADAYIKPNQGRRKVYLIPRAGDMQAPAQNALLKLLEEPPEYCAFLLLTDTADKLLETVRSRAVTLTMSPLSRDTLLEALESREPTVSREALARAMDRSDGYLGAALEALHAPDSPLDRQLDTVIEAIASGKPSELLSALLPLEKLKRQELLQLLTDLERTIVRAMDPASVSCSAKTLQKACSPQRLYACAAALRETITLVQANGSAGHAVGCLLGQL